MLNLFGLKIKISMKTKSIMFIILKHVHLFIHSFNIQNLMTKNPTLSMWDTNDEVLEWLYHMSIN
jgi:hypothetical protein